MTQTMSRTRAKAERSRVTDSIHATRAQIQQIDSQRLAHKKREGQFNREKNRLKRLLSQQLVLSDAYHKLLKNGRVTRKGITTVLTQ